MSAPERENHSTGPHALSEEIEAQTGRLFKLDETFFDEMRLYSGNCTLSDLAFTSSDYSRENYLRYAQALDGMASEKRPEPQGRLDEIATALYRAELTQKLFSANHPVFVRPVYPFSAYMSADMTAQKVSEILRGLNLDPKDKQVIMRLRIRTQLIEFPKRLSRLLDHLLDPPSQGLTKEEQQTALENFSSILDRDTEGSLYERMHALWMKQWESGDREITGIEEMETLRRAYQDRIGAQADEATLDVFWAKFDESMSALRDRVSQHEATRQAAWGRKHVATYIERLAIPHTPEEMLEYVRKQIEHISAALDSVAKQISPNANDWKDLWHQRSLPDGDFASQREKLLETYRSRTAEILTELKKRGLIPPIPKGCSIEIEFATQEMTRYFPKGYIRYPGYHEKEKVARLYLPHPDAFGEDPTIWKELHYGADLFSVHEAGAHALQSFYKTSLPEFFSMVGASATLGMEGHAFASELAALEEGVIPATMMNIFMVMRGRLQRAARAAFELKFHLGQGSAEELIAKYAEITGVGKNFARNDLMRGMSSFGQLLSYYVGAMGADSYAEIAARSGIDKTNAMRRWIENGGCQLPPNFQAYLEEWVETPSHFVWFDPQRSDPGVALLSSS